MINAPNPAPQPRSVSYLGWKVTGGVLCVIVTLAIGCLVADLVIWSLTWASPRVTMPDWIFAPFFAFAILGLIVTMAITAIVRGRQALPQLPHLRSVSRWQIGLLVIVATGFLISGPFELFGRVPGQPSDNAATHQYYFTSHGVATATTKAAYLAAVGIQTRAFLSFAIVITCVMIFFCVVELRRRSLTSAPRLAEIPAPSDPAPRMSLGGWTGGAVAVCTLAFAFLPTIAIVSAVDAYFSDIHPVTKSTTTQHLKQGQWVVFTWCETHATNAPYGCSAMTPDDIVIQDLGTGRVIPTSPDPSTDHISPENLPAAGQLIFNAPTSSAYAFHLTRMVPKGAFVAQSPGTVARSVIDTIALAVLGLAATVLALVLLARRINWRLRDAPRIGVDPF
jgi:hypothetical protein